LGQASIPILNKNGYSMFWLSSWDDIHSYSTNLNEDVFIRKFLYRVIDNKYSTSFYLNKNKLNHFSKKINYNFLKKMSKIDISKFLLRFYKIPYYLSKIRLIKYQNWLVIYFYIYNYNKNILKKNFKKNFFNFLKFNNKNSIYTIFKKSNFLIDF